MKKLLLISTLFFIFSCISFKFQRMSWSHDTETDTLKIFHEYEGIYTQDGKVSAEELEQYQKLMKSKNTYFFNNWIFEYPGTEVDKALTKDSLEPDERALLLLLKESVTVANGDFYANAAGELCGWQKVTVKNTSKILDLSNKLIRKAYEDRAKEEGEFYLAKPPEMKYVDIVNNQLIYRHAMKYDDYQKGKNDILKELLNSDSKHKDKVEALLKVLNQDVQINYKEPFLEVIAGKPGQKINVLESRTFMSEEKYNDAFKKKVAEDHKIMPELDTAKKDSFFK